MKTDGLEIRQAVGITLVDIASLESTQSLISIIFLQQSSAGKWLSTEILECPDIHLTAPGNHLFRTQRETSTMFIVSENISCIGIFQENTHRAFTAWRIPYAAHFPLGNDRQTFRQLGSLSRKGKISLLNSCEKGIRLICPIEQAVELDPLCPSKRRGFNIVSSLDNRKIQNVELAITATVLKRRNERRHRE